MSDERLCIMCQKPMDRISGIYCKECLKIHNDETRELKRKYREQGLCPNCGKKPMSGHVRCKRCQEVLDRAVRIYQNGFDPIELELDLKKLKKALENENKKC